MAIVFPMLNKPAIGYVFLEVGFCYEVEFLAIYFVRSLASTRVYR